ncbi:transmembrane protein 14C [Exaiptasia diaphana]|uniref:Transmembrane protein 14C n=1 Tax=Exaiptasia diaphana TaxID=2652724 RepID=A0A913Y3Z5_EXADI|nr:transmembrane protein 14C [Exaiptasia diaphana]KXJ29052.1 Transmembrane protein 14C [Exaiptasia diaphana]
MPTIESKPLKMSSPDYLSFGFAAIVALGGVVGYAKAGSTVSLAMGLSFGGIAAFGAVQTSRDPKNVWVLLVSSMVLAGAMGSRAVRSGKFMPAGLVATISAAEALRMGYRLLNR